MDPTTPEPAPTGDTDGPAEVRAPVAPGTPIGPEDHSSRLTNASQWVDAAGLTPTKDTSAAEAAALRADHGYKPTLADKARAMGIDVPSDDPLRKLLDEGAFGDQTAEVESALVELADTIVNPDRSQGDLTAAHAKLHALVDEKLGLGPDPTAPVAQPTPEVVNLTPSVEAGVNVYRRRPLTVRAVQVDSMDYDGMLAIARWCGGRVVDDDGERGATNHVIALDGSARTVYADPGDWIVEESTNPAFPSIEFPADTRRYFPLTPDRFATVFEEHHLPGRSYAEARMDQLAKFILDEVPGEPSQPQGAVETAIRLLRAAYVGVMLGTIEHRGTPPEVQAIRLEVATNAAGWSLAHPDDSKLGGLVVTISDEDVARARRVAERVVTQVDEFDRGLSEITGGDDAEFTYRLYPVPDYAGGGAFDPPFKEGTDRQTQAIEVVSKSHVGPPLSHRFAGTITPPDVAQPEPVEHDGEVAEPEVATEPPAERIGVPTEPEPPGSIRGAVPDVVEGIKRAMEPRGLDDFSPEERGAAQLAWENKERGTTFSPPVPPAVQKQLDERAEGEGEGTIR